MPRIPLPAAGKLSPEQQRVHDLVKGRSRGGRVGPPYQLALYCPEFLDKWQQVGEHLRYDTCLSPRLSELAILVTARHWNCQSEWLAHVPHALNGGLPDTVIEAVRLGRRPQFEDPDDEAVHDYCRELHESRSVGVAVYGRALDRLGAAGVVELTALAGHYAMVSMMLNAHEYGLPDGVAPPLPELDR